MRKIKVAAIQMRCSEDILENIAKAKGIARKAVEEGAQMILLPELFARPYFCQEKKEEYYAYAETVEESLIVREFISFAKEFKVVLPISFYEKDGLRTYNSVAVLDADGTNLGIYRKMHIPDQHTSQEKFYFSPGDEGFKTFKTAYGIIGVGIGWDQWFPETARSFVLQGAELLFYPTASGSGLLKNNNSMGHWRRVMQGHAAANLIPVIAANRMGTEEVKPCEENGNQESSLAFYGNSFIASETGKLVQTFGRKDEGILIESFDLDELAAARLACGLFRDRRPETYQL